MPMAIVDRITIEARRAALAARVAEAQRGHAELMQMLGELERNLIAMQGGLQELDGLLDTKEESGGDRDESAE